MLAACTVGLVYVNSHVVTLVGTNVSLGLPYGGVNEVAPC